MAKIFFSLVPDQGPTDIMKKVQIHLKKHAPAGVTVEGEVDHDGKPFFANLNSANDKAGIRLNQALLKEQCKVGTPASPQLK